MKKFLLFFMLSVSIMSYAEAPRFFQLVEYQVWDKTQSKQNNVLVHQVYDIKDAYVSTKGKSYIFSRSSAFLEQRSYTYTQMGEVDAVSEWKYFLGTGVDNDGLRVKLTFAFHSVTEDYMLMVDYNDVQLVYILRRL